jgi:arginyl-tRNA synthetase
MTTRNLIDEIAAAVRSAYDQELDLGKLDVIFTADPAHGDVATNAAMIIAKQVGESPKAVAARLVEVLRGRLEGFERMEVAGPGFINLTWADGALWKLAEQAVASRPKLYQKQQVVTEYSDPNPFKALHAGHLYTTIVGDAVSRLLEAGGATVHRINYGGDVGLHVGKAMWGIRRHLGGEFPEKLAEVPVDERPIWISARYVEGNQAYEQDEAARKEIIACNQRAYALHEENDHTSAFAQIYWTCREWSYDGFRSLYERLEITPFERYLPESEVTPTAIEMVRRGAADGVLTKSDGATVYKGEAEGLHTRVFLTAAGLPTYEAKDLGLAALKWRDYKFDHSIIITANDIVEYMKVVLAVLGHFYPEVVPRTTHLVHGLVKLPGGIKMSSRMGNTLSAHDILDAAEAANRKQTGKDDWRVVVSAVKYAFLKQRIGGDMIYSPDESVSLEGNSGPYLQYAHARARSILAKSAGESHGAAPKQLQPDERLLVRKLAQYAEERYRAVDELAPHVIAGYLYELAQQFNRFYEANRVMGDKRELVRVKMVGVYAGVLKDGLELLGMDAPERL